MRTLLTALAVIISFTSYSQVFYPLIIENDTNYTLSHLFPGPIISPSDSALPLAVHDTNRVVWESDTSITLKDGFTASSFADTGYFQAKITSMPIKVVLIAPVPASTDTIIHVPKWEKLEIGIELPQNYTAAIDSFFSHYYDNPPIDASADLNPYADDSLKLEMHLTSPSSAQITKYGFFCRMAQWSGTADSSYMVEGTGDSLYPYKIRFRFSPTETGLWSFYFTISAPHTTGLSIIQYDFFGFYCDNPLSDNHGYLGLNSNNDRYLQFDPPYGAGFFGIGENGPDGNPGYGYESYYHAPYTHRPYKKNLEIYLNTLDEMHSAGANYSRIFMDIDDFAVEWDNLGVYDRNTPEYYCPEDYPWWLWTQVEYRGNRQFNCWLLDKVVDRLRYDNVYAQVCVQPYFLSTAYQGFIWGNHAFVKYLDVLLGPHHRNDVYTYFSDSTLRYYWKRRYKYILARWGYSTNIAAFETFNEIDQALEYDYQNCGCSVCPYYQQTYSESSTLKSKIDDWHNDIIGYVKSPTDSGGLGEPNHLFTVSYTDYGTYGYTGYQNYHLLFSNSNIDIADIHQSDFGHDPSAIERPFNLTNYFIRGTALFSTSPDIYGIGISKPFHQGECHVNMNTPDTNEVSKWYNNYDIAFHNKIWSAAFSGAFTTPLEWEWPLIHRLHDANPGAPSSPQNIGDVIPNLNSPSCGAHISITIDSYYYHYQRLSEFMSNINFNDNLVPSDFTDYSHGIECFYLSQSNLDKTYGWVHNSNSYWYNKYYYLSSDENYCGCSAPASPYNQYVFIPGFHANSDYTVTFYQTQITQTLPQSYTTTANSSGEVELNFGSVPLDCNPENADYAFIIDDPNQNRLQTKVSYDSEFDFNLYPNPTNGKFTLSFTDFERKELSIQNPLGQLTYKQAVPENEKSVVVDLSSQTKGIYFVTLRGAEGKKTKKIIIF